MVCSPAPSPGRVASCLLLASCAALTLTGCTGLNSTSSANPQSRPVTGMVHGGQQPVTGSQIVLWAAGTTGDGSAATPLTTPILTDPSGSFRLDRAYTCPSASSLTYITATGGNPGLSAQTNNDAIVLLATTGRCGDLSSSTFISIDEISTVAAVAALTPYMNAPSQIGAANDANLVAAFHYSSSLIAEAADANYLQKNTLADIVATCVNTAGRTSTACTRLLGDTAGAHDTASALLWMMHHPGANVPDLLTLITPVSPFQPTYLYPPSNWTLHPTTLGFTLNNNTAFFGDSITQYWPLPLHNFGIAGQHVSEMFPRLATDVLGHNYQRVVILAGSNDVFNPIAASPTALIQIAQMASMASAANIQPILCLLPPAVRFGTDYSAQVTTFNQGIRQIAAANGYLLIDYNTPMTGHPEYFGDGVHPVSAGYTVMEATLSSVMTQ